MRLDEYLRKTGESVRAFARRAGVCHSSVRRILDGHDATGRTWAAIEVATQGRVSFRDHFPMSAA